MPKPFADVTARTQVERFRRLARTALPAWGLGDATLPLLNHGYNTTFRVDTADGRRFALRVNTMPFKTPEHLLAEVSWLAAVSEETGLRVPTPQPTLEGRWSATVPSPGHGRDLPLVLFSWLEGPNIGSRWTLTQARTVGAAMATLHDHAERWTMPPGARLTLFDNVLTDLPNRFGDHPALNDEAREVLGAAYERAQAFQDAAFEAGPVIALHADLHGGNLKWHQGRLSIFDFDDAGLGVPALDLAIAAYYLRDRDDLEDALRAGYSTVRTLPQVTAEQFEAMVAGRNLLLVDDLLEQQNAELQAFVPTYVESSVRRLRGWLQTGTYHRESPAG